MKRRSFLQAALATIALAVSTASSTLRGAVANVCDKVVRRRRGIILPPVPKWSPATDDIDGADFFRRSLDYERSLLPANLVFPREGQIWEAVCDCEVPVMKRVLDPKGPWVWPSRGLRQGERVRILPLDHPKPLQVRFRPVRSQEFHCGADDGSIAPESLREELWLRMACTVPVSSRKVGYFSEWFRLVEDAA